MNAFSTQMVMTTFVPSSSSSSHVVVESKQQQLSSDDLPDLLTLKSRFNIPSFRELVNIVQKNPLNTTPPEMSRLYSMKPAILELDAMVGQEKVKESILRLILFAAQGVYKKQNSMMNVCIFAPPGSGKTKLTQIIADIYYHSGLLPKTEHNTKQRYIKGTRSNLIAGFLGQTAPLTQKMIDQCLKEGKALLLDEVYMLNSAEKRDSFSKECIDTINFNMTEHPELRVIIGGYRVQTKECFFDTNEGLQRRFRFMYDLQTYTPGELREMFFQQLSRYGYDVENIWKVATLSWFTKNKKDFCFAGGDIESLSSFALLHSSQRCFGLPNFLKTFVNKNDLEGALEDLKESRIAKDESIPLSVAMMYQ